MLAKALITTLRKVKCQLIDTVRLYKNSAQPTISPAHVEFLPLNSKSTHARNALLARAAIMLTALSIFSSSTYSKMLDEQPVLHSSTNTINKNTAKTLDAENVIEVIQVTGNQIKPLHITTFKREDFINTTNTLGEILSTINGIQIRQIGGIGNPVAVSIRGSTTKQVKLYIDGQLVNDSQFGGFDLNQIPTEHIESIEISKSQTSGSGASPIGGEIRINTYNATKTQNRLSLTLGSFGYKEANWFSNYSGKKFNLSLGLNRLSVENDYKYQVPKNYYQPSVSTKEKLQNNKFDKTAVIINVNGDFQQHQTRLNAQYLKQDKALPFYQTNNPFNQSSLTSDSYRVSYQHQWLLENEFFDATEFETHLESKDEQYIKNDDGKEENKAVSDYQTNKYYFSIQPLFNLSLENGELNIRPYLTFNNQEFESKTDRVQVGCTSFSCDILAKQQQLNSGVRFDWQSEKLPLSSYFLLNQLDEKNSHEKINNESADLIKEQRQYHTQELGFNYQMNKLTVAMNFSNSIRTPSMFELFGDRGAFKGNDELLPEKAKNISLSSTYKNKHFSLSSSLYHQSLEDTIVALFNNGVGGYDNVSDSTLYGVELQSDHHFSKSLTLTTKIHLLNSITDSKISAFDQKRLPGIYHQQYSVSLSYAPTDYWNLYLSAYKDESLYFNRVNKSPSDNYTSAGEPQSRTITDVSTNWTYKFITLNLSIKNLFNTPYQDLANRPAPGRNIQLKLSIEDI